MALFRSRLVSLSRPSLYFRFESSLKSTVASDTAAIPKTTTVDQNHFNFPWRERPDLIETSWMKKLTFDGARRMIESSIASFPNEKDIVEGSASAFVACLNGIFQHKLVENVCLQHSKDEELPKDSPILNKNEVPLLNDILEQKLAQFYENAILKCSINRQDLGYMLSAADQPVIVDKEFIIGSTRQRQVTKIPIAVSHKNFGITYVVDENPSDVSDLHTLMKKTIDSGFVSVRYWVDIPCEGLLVTIMNLLYP